MQLILADSMLAMSSYFNRHRMAGVACTCGIGAHASSAYGWLCYILDGRAQLQHIATPHGQLQIDMVQDELELVDVLHFSGNLSSRLSTLHLTSNGRQQRIVQVSVVEMNKISLESWAHCSQPGGPSGA